MEEFQCKTTIYSGPGAVSALAGMGGQRLMLVTDPFFMKNGTAQRQSALRWSILIRCSPTPRWSWRRRGRRG